MQATSVDLWFFWMMVFAAYIAGMLCKAWLSREERRETRQKLDEAARIVGQVHGLAILCGVTLPSSVQRGIRNLVGSVRG